MVHKRVFRFSLCSAIGLLSYCIIGDIGLLRENQRMFLEQRLMQNIQQEHILIGRRKLSQLDDVLLAAENMIKRNTPGPKQTDKELGLTETFWRKPNPHDFQYIINEPDFCRNQSLDILIWVLSAPGNFFERNIVRKTYAAGSPIYAVRYKAVFLLAKTLNRTEQELIEIESSIFHDVIQESFIDSYRNLSLKSIMGVKWVSTFCPNVELAVKTDDDVFVNAFELVRTYLKWNTKLSRKGKHFRDVSMMICGDTKPMRTKVVRNNTDIKMARKWIVTENDYPGKYYPPYCIGLGYIMTAKAATQLYVTSLTTKLLFLEDVWVTGIVGHFAGVKVVWDKLNNFWYIRPHLLAKNSNLVNGRVFHYTTNSQLRFLWWHALRANPKVDSA